MSDSFNELVPGHMHLRAIAQQVRTVSTRGAAYLGVRRVGVCDGLAMNHRALNYSLVSREVIAVRWEIMARAHVWTACAHHQLHKIVPCIVIAAARLDLPAVGVSGGPMLAGFHRGRRVENKDVLEGVGAHFRGRLTSEELGELEEVACPTCGSCAGLFTANSMSCLTECLGLALPGDGTMPAVFSARLELARRTGAQAVEVVRRGWGARRFLTLASLRNALTLDAALGCSTNTVLHLIAIAHEVGLELPLETFNEGRRTRPIWSSCRLPAVSTWKTSTGPAGSWRLSTGWRRRSS